MCRPHPMNIPVNACFSRCPSPCLPSLSVGFGGIWQLSRSEDRLEYFNENTLASVRHLNGVYEAVSAMRIGLHRHAMTDDTLAKKDAEALIEKAARRA